MFVQTNLVPRAHVPFGQHQDTELWNNQFPETKILGLSVSRRMRGLVYMASRDKVDVDTFHKGIQYALEKLGKSKFGFERTAVSNFKSKRHEGSGNELVDYSRAPCLGADQKARGLWERDCVQTRSASALRVKLQRLDSSVSSVMAASMGSAFQICCHLFLKVRGS